MMKIFSLIIAVFAMLTTYGQTIIIIDKSDMLPIKHVSIFNQSKLKAIESNAKGEADLSGFSENDSIFLTHISFVEIKSTKTDLLHSGKEIYMTEKVIRLDEVVFSANRTEESQKKVAQQIQVMSEREIESSQAQSTADLISNTGSISMQKSQSGGGSPTIRGFEASRIVLVVDGVRMNNLIYRAGHLQNIVTIDNNILDRTEILFGPSSTIYGSDALGGVIHFFTKKPMLANADNSYLIKANYMVRYGYVNNEITNHVDFNFGKKKYASLTSFSYSKFDDMKSGTNQNPFYTSSYGERPYYVERINDKDSLVKNSSRYLQKQSAYNQYDILQKFIYQQNEHLSHGLNIQFSNSTNVPRYDRLTDPGNTGLAYAEWYYGPQTRLLTAYNMDIKDASFFFQNVHFDINYQQIEESRHSRKFNSNNLLHRIENVNVIGTNVDFQKSIKSHKIRLGFDGQYNTLKSTADKENIVTGEHNPLDTRYPDGNNSMVDIALYVSHTWEINNELILTDGLRGGLTNLHSSFNDTTFFKFPFTQVDQKNTVYSGSIGIINTPTDDLKLSTLLSTGFRAPNVDDLSKIFESAPGNIIVPNNNLKPEKTINTELGITKIFNQKTSWENVVYYTQFFDAIMTDKFTYNGQDSIMYDGIKSQIYANQNKKRAYLYGFSTCLKSKLTDDFLINFSINYTYGRAKTDSSDAPLDHIAPIMAKIQFIYTNKKISSDFFVIYNGWKKLKDYSLGGEDNEQYATALGMPAWVTANFRTSYKVHKLLTVQAGVDNIFDTQYRTFASGINAPGRNIFGSLRFHF